MLEKNHFMTLAVGAGVLLVGLSATLAAFSYKKSIYTLPSKSLTISVSGEGKVMVKPDIASFSFTSKAVAMKVAEAQDKVEAQIKAVTEALTKLGVDEKDIRVESYNVYPKYAYSSVYCVSAPCGDQKPKLEGYEVSQYVSVKVRDIALSGDVVTALGSLQVTEFSGPNFAVDNVEQVREAAKKEAIAEAKRKAEATARALGKDLGKMVEYTEGSSGFPYPAFYKGAEMAVSAVGGMSDRATLPAGETTVTSSVTLTYEVR